MDRHATGPQEKAAETAVRQSNTLNGNNEMGVTGNSSKANVFLNLNHCSNTQDQKVKVNDGNNSRKSMGRVSVGRSSCASSEGGLRLNLGGVNKFNDDEDESYDDEEEEDDQYGYEDEAAANSGTVFGSTTGVEGPKNGSQSKANLNSAAPQPTDLITQVQKNQGPAQQTKGAPFVHNVDDQPKDLLGPQPADKVGMKTLVLDLDETLVRSQFVEPEKYDLLLPVRLDNRSYQVYVQVRPGTAEFLEEMAKCYELVIFTASLSKYANPLMDILDPERYCTGRLFREHCVYADRVYMKDMAQLGRRIEDVILIDNSPNSYRPQPENAIPILSWYDDPDDTELWKITPLLRNLARVEDVRSVLGSVHENHEMDLAKAEQMAEQLRKDYELRLSAKAKAKGQRPSNLNSSDFDLNDRTSDMDLMKIMDQPFGSRQKQKVAQKKASTSMNQESFKKAKEEQSIQANKQMRKASASSASLNNIHSKALTQNQPVGRASVLTQKANNRLAQKNANKLTQSNQDQKLSSLQSSNSLEKPPLNNNAAVASQKQQLIQDASRRFQSKFEQVNQQQTANDVAYRNSNNTQADGANNERSAVKNAKIYQQAGQGNQGACLSNEEMKLMTNRTFMNERTDLTATEVSPRIKNSEVDDASSGKRIKINTRVIKLSQEKTSIKMLNVKGRVQTTRIRRIMQSLSSNDSDPACLAKLSGFSQASEMSNQANKNTGTVRSGQALQTRDGSKSSNLMQANSKGLAIQVSQQIQQREQLLTSLLQMNSPVSANIVDFRNPSQPAKLNERQPGTGKSTVPPKAPNRNLQQAASLNFNTQERRSHKPNKLTLELSDERNCNLEDEDSDNEKTALPFYRSVMTPTTGARKSSINATPKSKVIEPGKIFSQRQMTPGSLSGMRGRLSNNALRTALSKPNNETDQSMRHKHSRSGLATQPVGSSTRQGFRQQTANSFEQVQISGFNHKRGRVDSLGSANLRLK